MTFSTLFPAKIRQIPTREERDNVLDAKQSSEPPSLLRDRLEKPQTWKKMF